MQQVSHYIKAPVSSEKVADIWFVDEATKFEQLLKGFYFLKTQFRIHTARGGVKLKKINLNPLGTSGRERGQGRTGDRYTTRSDFPTNQLILIQLQWFCPLQIMFLIQSIKYSQLRAFTGEKVKVRAYI